MQFFKNPRKIACHQFWHCFSPKILNEAVQNCFKNRASLFHYLALFIFFILFFWIQIWRNCFRSCLKYRVRTQGTGFGAISAQHKSIVHIERNSLHLVCTVVWYAYETHSSSSNRSDRVWRKQDAVPFPKKKARLQTSYPTDFADYVRCRFWCTIVRTKRCYSGCRCDVRETYEVDNDLGCALKKKFW